tara:strand:+ start:3773 stop:5428 length:1656 start_codon:yes stop_codon:yes gene_type:complete
MSVGVNEFKPLQFKPQLKYKIGNNTFKYLNIDKFSFDKIRNNNIYDREKEKFIQNKLSDKQPYIWNDKPNNHIEFKNYLNNLDQSENIFKIPLSSFYFTYENLNAIISENNFQNLSQNKNNYDMFFIVNEDNAENQISEYFNALKKNYNANIREAGKTSSTNSIDEIFDWNNNTTRKEIVRKFGKFLLTESEIANADTNLKSNDKKLKIIITYYNILKILETFYINRDCILKEKIFEEIDGDIQETKNPVYIKIKKIKPVKLTEEQIQSSFGYNILKPIYEIEFERVDNLSKLEFHLNLKDQYNPERLINNMDNSYSIETDDKYKIYPISIFSNIKEKNFYVDINLDYNRFHNLKENNFTTRTKINMNKLIKKYYIDEIFFKPRSYLKHNNQYAIIENTIIRSLNKPSDREQRNILDEESTFYNEKPSSDIRLAVDNLESKIITYLDVKLTYKKNLTDRIPLKKQLTQKLGCINRASTIDGLLYDFIGNNYKRNMLEEKMINKSDDITNILESSKQSTHQTGGVKTKSMARKRKNLKKRRTLKSLIRYYAN